MCCTLVVDLLYKGMLINIIQDGVNIIVVVV